MCDNLCCHFVVAHLQNTQLPAPCTPISQSSPAPQYPHTIPYHTIDDDLRLPLVGPKINQAKHREAG